MEIFVHLIKLTADLVVSALMLAMFVRAVLSFLFVDEDGGISVFFVMITEPVIYPVRLLFEKLGVAVGIPVDIPFLVTYFVLVFISMLL